MLENKEISEFWITNITYLGGPRKRMNILLNDLQLLIKPGQSYNLLNSYNFNYTMEQILNSAESGSLYQKRDKVIIRMVAPKPSLPPGIYLSTDPGLIKPLWSQVEIIEPKYEELEISAEQLADEITEIIDET